MHVRRIAVLCGAGLCVAGLCVAMQAAHAQTHRQSLPSVNFDMWCQQTQNLPPARCDKRLPQDDAAFQAYVDMMEQYETQQLNQDMLDRRIERTIRRGDPIDSQGPPAPITPPQP
jgi:hypothetical protein